MSQQLLKVFTAFSIHSRKVDNEYAGRPTFKRQP